MIKLAGILALLMFLPTQAIAQDCAECDAVAKPIVTYHRLAVPGGIISYAAEAGQIAIRDVETGKPHAFIFYIAYRVPSANPRPLTFVWNGGPGANSAVLHFQVAGPKRLIEGQLIDNPQSWLQSTDLVFVDPVGTGFSHPTSAQYAAEFYSTVGDVASLTEFVRAWRLEHGAEDAPLYLVGESWGAGRAASVGWALQKRSIDVNGLFLISGGAGMAEPIQPALATALRVLDLTDTGRFHGRVPVEPRTTREVIESWARLVYTPALEHPDALSSDGREAIVRSLSLFTGMPPDRIDRKTLRITPHAYRTGLLAEQKKTLGLFDMRSTTPEADVGGREIVRYLRYDLGYHTSRPYVGIESVEMGYAAEGKYPAPVGESWDYSTAHVTAEERLAAMTLAQLTGDGPPVLGPRLPGTRELVALNPNVRILVAAGQYDSLNSCAVNAESAKHLSGVLAKAVKYKCYLGGHMMYRDQATRIAISRDLAALVAK